MNKPHIPRKGNFARCPICGLQVTFKRLPDHIEYCKKRFPSIAERKKEEKAQVKLRIPQDSIVRKE